MANDLSFSELASRLPSYLTKEHQEYPEIAGAASYTHPGYIISICSVAACKRAYLKAGNQTQVKTCGHWDCGVIYAAG